VFFATLARRRGVGVYRVVRALFCAKLALSFIAALCGPSALAVLVVFLVSSR